jgi:SPP1 gp7 family putative phage head morphogenesis protein
VARPANEVLFDRAVRHHVSLLRFAEGQAEAIAAVLQEAEDDLLGQITAAMARGASAARMEAVLASILERRLEVLGEGGDQLQEALHGLAEADVDWESSALQGAVPIQLNLATVPLETVRAAAMSPINGLPLKGWLDGIAASDAQRLQQAVNLAVVQGQTIDDLVRRIRGTKANGFQDGVLSTTTRNAQALARTAVSHVSNQARELVWDANEDIVQALRWTATLDGRTTTLCMGRDGHMVPIGGSPLPEGAVQLLPEGARPPAHFNCRSLMVAVLDGLAIAGNRPFVADARTRAKREADFRKEAKSEGKTLQQVRSEWAASKVGTVPADTTADAWMRRQPKAFQDEVLGPGKAEVFRGGLPLARFNDASGRSLTLDELRGELSDIL